MTGNLSLMIQEDGKDNKSEARSVFKLAFQ